MAFELTDDGTMDTVVRCTECGQELRYNYDPSGPGAEDSELSDEDAYDAFIAECIEDAESEHECGEPTEPEDGDLTTGDHATFYQYGRLVLERPRVLQSQYYLGTATYLDTWYFYDRDGRGRQIELGIFDDDHVAAVRAYMDRAQFWPNCWFISDHGNAHLMDLTPKTEEK